MLLRLFLVLLTSFVFQVPALAQAPATAENGNSTQIYKLHLAEIHFAEGKQAAVSDEPDGIDAEIIRLKSSGSLEDVDYIRATIVAEEQTSLTYGRMISVVTGVSKTAAGTTRQTQWRDIGSTLNVAISAEGEKIRVMLSFRNARATKEFDPEIGPDILNTQYQTSLLLNPGETTLVGSNEESCLLIRVEKR